MLNALILSLSLVGCVEDVSKDKVEATVAEAKKVEAPTTGESWTVQKDGSKIHALGAKVTATHPVDFHDFEGKLQVDGDKLVGVEFTVQMATLTSDHPKLTKHLLNADFFDVEKHPTSSFVSTSVKQEGDKATVVGNLTIMGTSKSVEFPASVSMKDGKLTAKTEFAINRQDFGVSYPGRPDDLIQDKVVMTIELTASK